MKTDRLSPLGVLAGAFMPLAFADHGRALLSLSHDYELIKSTLDDGTAQPIRPRLAADSRILSCGISPNKRFAALGLNTGEVHVWDLLVPKEVGKIRGTKTVVRSVAISNDGESIAASDWEGNLGMVSIAGGPSTTIPAEKAVVTSLGFSPNGGLLAIGNDKGYLLIWDVVEKSIVLRSQAHSAMISCLFFSPDRSRLLTGGADGLIVAWTTQSWRPLAAWSVSAEGPPSQHGIYALEMDDAGLWLIAMTYDGYLQRWACNPNFQPDAIAR